MLVDLIRRGLGGPPHNGELAFESTTFTLSTQVPRPTEKRAEERLRHSRDRLKSAVELAGLGLYSIEIEDGKSRLVWDDRVRTMWGLSGRTKVTLQVWLDGIHPEDRDRVEAAVERLHTAERAEHV